ncbi:PDZ domain-containing protein [Sphingopyxis sp. PET50]|uniref:PDZ domain-containing protein n=1 Tax=Sphingopyxis sp. PET50 TaxID=2976533 RepID=UPI0021AF7285|nr:PDZ domain-containing protein [Sphingopyxis sp. PET50]
MCCSTGAARAKACSSTRAAAPIPRRRSPRCPRRPPRSGRPRRIPLPPPANCRSAALKSGVGFVPRSENGRVTGVVVQPQGDGATFRAAGLRPGDVIRGINGRPIGSAGDAAALANQFAPGARLSLEVERGAEVVPIAIFVSK